ncbi:MAG: nucleotidyltransferase family protein [Myxococcales bacterium]|nr:nucleotidyltransferase family protein [Myxococcales bacterium]
MAASLLELFRVLASFEPARVDLKDAPWERYADWAIAQGLAPLAAYNLEYRLANSRAPEWVRDRLLSIYQGTANDNVMKLVNFKRAVDALEGRRVVLLGAGDFAESLYPHVAFRPVIELRLLLPRPDVDAFAGFLRRSQFRLDEAIVDPLRADRVLTDTRTLLFLHGALVGDPAEDEGLFTRSAPLKVYGPSVRRLELEDALLVHALMLARAGFEAPLIELVDLRELVLGAPARGGAYSRAVDADALHRRAKAWGAERGLYAALALVERLFPETKDAVARLRPALSLPVRELLERLVVQPKADLDRTHAFKGEEALRALLAG